MSKQETQRIGELTGMHRACFLQTNSVHAIPGDGRTCSGQVSGMHALPGECADPPGMTWQKHKEGDPPDIADERWPNGIIYDKEGFKEDSPPENTDDCPEER
jgi:hypothetical protein